MKTIAYTFIALILNTAMAAARAQNYPAKPIPLVVAFTPGGGGDINARLIASKLTEYPDQ